MRCEICGKTSVFGKKVAHDRMYVNKRTNKKIKPNLQSMKVETVSGTKSLTVCTRCLRSIKHGKASALKNIS